MGFLDKLRAGLSRTKQNIVGRFDEIVRRADAPERRARPVDVETIDALEELLISADVGVAATDRIIASDVRPSEVLGDLDREKLSGSCRGRRRRAGLP